MQKIQNNVLRCSNCGGSDIRLDEETGKLKCTHCRSLIDGVLSNEADDVSALTGKIISGGAKKIIDVNTMVTLKCSSCGAAVFMNTDEATSARCPWCRHILSFTDKLPNGATPDLILPFKVSHKEAAEQIRKYIKRCHSIAEPGFIKEFNENAIMGVYLPYMVIDMNVHAKMSGKGEVETRRYTVGSGDAEQTRYDADVYEVSREFDLAIDDLTIEASSDKLNQNIFLNTNNVINAIMPFDTENAVAWDPRFVRGYTCERRDVDVEDLDRRAKLQVEDIMRYRMRSIVSKYNRGVNWDKMRLEQKGVKWQTAYLPVWLYSYLDKNSNGINVLHYVAVNGRSEEVVGSTPINWPRVITKIALVPGLILLNNIIVGSLASHGIGDRIPTMISIVAGLVGAIWLPVAAIVVGGKASTFRNRTARHMHEKETRSKITHVESNDIKKESLHGLSYSMMMNRNDNTVKGIIRTDESKGVPSAILMTMMSILAVLAGMFISCMSIVRLVNNYQDLAGKKRVNNQLQIRYEEKRENDLRTKRLYRDSYR